MNRNELTPDLIKQLNNEYGDIISPNDPTLLKCKQIIEQRLD